MPVNYYNEIDSFAAQWLRHLIDAELIPYGIVDTRDIRDVQPSDLAGFTQCHFFAGIGGWPYALHLAGVPTSMPLWTGSCPCQPFSAAGKRGAFNDSRHLWPEWFRLIRQCKPATIFGEQVASPDGLRWFDLVSTDLEDAGYAVGAADLCAASVEAPHIRQRLFFVANAGHRSIGNAGEFSAEVSAHARSAPYEERNGVDRPAAYRGAIGVLADSLSTGLEERQEQSAWQECAAVERSGDARGVGNAARYGERQPWIDQAGEGRQSAARGSSPWCDLEWLPCIDGKTRPTKPGLFPLAHGIPARVGRLRAYGNAIVPQVAAEFIRTYLLTVRL